MPNFRVTPYPEPYYGPHNLGGLCSECGNPMPAALAGVDTMHPTCEPDWPPMLAALHRTMVRRKALE